MIPNNLPHRSYIQGLWHLDETSGTRYDETDNNNDLTDNNTVGYSSSGKIGNAADFESTNSEYLKITDASQTGLDFTGSFSVCAWVKRESIAKQIIVGKDAASNRSYTCFLEDNVLSFSVFRQSDESESLLTGNNVSSTGVWYHLAWVYEGISDGASKMNLYINGSSGATEKTNAVYPVKNAGAYFSIGAREHSASQKFFDGLIDEVIVWNKALTADEVAIVYNISAYSYFIPQIIIF